MFGLAERGEGLLEVVDHGAADKPGGPDRLQKNFGQFFFEFNVRRNQIKERNAGIRIVMRSAHFLVSWFGSIWFDSIGRNTFAGFPATMVFAGTSLVTTLPAPTIAFSPIVRFDRMVAPEPIDAPFFTMVRSTFQ